jgi:hypothetical protein
VKVRLLLIILLGDYALGGFEYHIHCSAIELADGARSNRRPHRHVTSAPEPLIEALRADVHLFLRVAYATHAITVRRPQRDRSATLTRLRRNILRLGPTT